MLVVVHLDTDVSVDERYRSDIVKRECHEVDLGMLRPFPRGSVVALDSTRRECRHR
jgi:hypothetical protein